MMNLLDALRTLKDNDGLTLKNYKAINYKSGFQVADFGVECKTAEEAYKAIKEMNGNAGVWFSNGIYYIDHSFRTSTLKKAREIGLINNQQSILRWKDKALIWLTR